METLKRSDWKTWEGLTTARIVLTTWNETTPWVTHIELENGSKIGGHYHRDYVAAEIDYQKRVKKNEAKGE